MKSVVLLVVAALTLLAADSASAQDVKLLIRDGRVTLTARNAAVRQILAEWARIGGIKIVNGEKVVGTPVTLQLTDVPERQALDTVLRSVSGYLLAPRHAGAPGASTFDRILILPTSTAPAAPPPPPPGFAGGPARLGPVPRMPGDAAGQPPADTSLEMNDPVDPGSNGPTAVRRPAPTVRPPIVRPPLSSEEPDEPAEVPEASAPVAMPTAPGNPFGVPSGSGLPGAIAPVPRPAQPAPRAQQ